MKSKLLTLILFLTLQSYAQDCCITNNFFNNGGFETGSINPTPDDDDLNNATNWHFIWSSGRADWYNENTPNDDINIIPTPADGNYASCWINHYNGHEFREGFINQLNTIINPNSGNYTISFDMANLYGSEGSEVGIYGVYNSGNSTLPNPSNNFIPSNTDLFGNSNTVLLGIVDVPPVGNSKQPFSIQFNTNSNAIPSNGISHIMITNSGNSISAKSYVAFDNFCLTESSVSDIQFSPTYQMIGQFPSFYDLVDVAVYCHPGQIVLDGSNSENETLYSIEVYSFDLANWITGQSVHYSGDISGSVPSNIDISNEFNWALNTIYRVKLITYPCYDESNIFFMITEPKIE